jgi:putative tricarboxylic transport membrane protein
LSANNENEADDGPALVCNRTVDISVALLFLAISALVIFESTRLGFGWQEGQGPAPGYFPFYVAVFMGLASMANLVRAMLGLEKGAAEAFVSTTQFGRVLSVLLPTVGYVLLIQFLGIFVASAIFIFGFMTYFGKEPILKAIAVSIGVPVALFFMFEKWFLVPLPKGPLEAMLGLG